MELHSFAKATPTSAPLYTAESLLATGNFSSVYRGIVIETGEEIAIKRITIKKHTKNRELTILRSISHRNVVQLVDAFYSPALREEEVRLNLVMKLVPETLQRLLDYYRQQNHPIPLLYVKLYTYQMLRGLGYLHINGICHRDIKPANLLIDPRTHSLQLGDFSSAKHISYDESSANYVGARHYRAPELLFGARKYTETVDLWSAGCVLAEMLLGRPLFQGKTDLEQLVEVIKVLGTPSKAQVTAMNPVQGEFRFPALPKKPWPLVLRPGTPADAINLIEQLLVYVPTARLTAVQALNHDFFAELRVKSTHLPSGRELPPLFDWNEQELEVIPSDLLLGLPVD